MAWRQRPPQDVFAHYAEWLAVYERFDADGQVGDVLEFLLAHRAAVNNRCADSDNTLLHLALRWGCDRGVISVFRDLGANPHLRNIQNQTPADVAAINRGADDAAQLIVDVFGADDEQHRLALWHAARVGRFMDMMQILREHPHLVNRQGYGGKAVVHYVALHGPSEGLVRALVALGAALELRTYEGETPAAILRRTFPKSSVSMAPGVIGIPRVDEGSAVAVHAASGAVFIANVVHMDHDDEGRMLSVESNRSVSQVPLWRLTPQPVIPSDNKWQELLQFCMSCLNTIVPPGWTLSPNCTGDGHPFCADCLVIFLWVEYTRMPFRTFQCPCCSAFLSLDFTPGVRLGVEDAWPPRKWDGKPMTTMTFAEFEENVARRLRESQEMDIRSMTEAQVTQWTLERLELLQNTQKGPIGDLTTEDVPLTRACPSCGLIVFSDGECKYATCPLAACKHTFCFVCLRGRAEHSDLEGSAFCLVAPIQKSLPSKTLFLDLFPVQPTIHINLPPQDAFAHYDEWRVLFERFKKDRRAEEDVLLFLQSHPEAVNNRKVDQAGTTTLRGSTFLHLAMFWGCDQGVIEILRDYGANPHLLNVHGKTPAGVSTLEDSNRSVEEAAQLIVDVFGPDDEHDRSALLHAARLGYFAHPPAGTAANRRSPVDRSVLHILRERPHLANTQGYKGWGVLHHLARHGPSQGLTNVLVGLGASLELRTWDGETADAILRRTFPSCPISIVGGPTPTVGMGSTVTVHLDEGNAFQGIVGDMKEENKTVLIQAHEMEVWVPHYRVTANPAIPDPNPEGLLQMCLRCWEAKVPPGWKIASECMPEDHAFCPDCLVEFLWAEYNCIPVHLPFHCCFCNAMLSIDSPRTGHRAQAAWPPGKRLRQPFTTLLFDEFRANVARRLHEEQMTPQERDAKDEEEILQILQMTDEEVEEEEEGNLQGIEGVFPRKRACPKCGTTFCHGGDCKYMTCPRSTCKHRFCFACLRTPSEHPTDERCSVAEIQTYLPKPAIPSLES